MTEADFAGNLRRLTTPRAAAIAGILFSLLFSFSLVLIRLAIPEDPAATVDWTETGTGQITLALKLMPFATRFYLVLVRNMRCW